MTEVRRSVNGGGAWRGRPPQVWTMALMLCIAVALCLAGAVFPATPASPARLDAVLACIGLATGSALWWSHGRLQGGLVHVAGAVYLTGTTSLVAEAATGEGAASAAVAYVWLCMHAASFSRRRVARSYATLSAAALAVALWSNPVIVSPQHTWPVLAVTLVAAVETLSGFLKRIRAMATTDQLTGLPNRAGLEGSLVRELAAAARASTPLTLAVLDLDNFKLVNDREGHVAGDRLLVTLTGEWAAGIRPRDRLFRYGGDEFVLLLPATDEVEATALLQRLRTTSQGSWSYGVCSVLPGDRLEDCLARADRRMYAHKSREVAAS